MDIAISKNEMDDESIQNKKKTDDEGVQNKMKQMIKEYKIK